MFFLKVGGLTSGAVYQFRVYGASLVGLGKASKPSAQFKCEAWTMPEPGNESFTLLTMNYMKNID